MRLRIIYLKGSAFAPVWMVQQEFRDFGDNRMWKNREAVVMSLWRYSNSIRDEGPLGKNQVTMSERSVGGTNERDYDADLRECGRSVGLHKLCGRWILCSIFTAVRWRGDNDIIGGRWFQNTYIFTHSVPKPSCFGRASHTPTYTPRCTERGEPLPLRNMCKVTFRLLRNDHNLLADLLSSGVTIE